MASVGGVTCHIVRPSSPPAKKQRVLTWIVAGLTGVGAHKLGLNDSEFEFELVYFGPDALCDVWATAIGALQATVVTIIDDHPDTYAGMLITGMTNPKKTPAAHAAGSLLDKRTTITIRGVIT